MIEMISEGKVYQDCTSNYILKFNENCTVKELLDFIKSRHEHGTIIIDNEHFVYNNDEMEITGYESKIVISATANGGYSLMDYTIKTDSFPGNPYIINGRKFYSDKELISFLQCKPFI